MYQKRLSIFCVNNFYRFLQQVLTPLSKGLSARIELKKKTEEECLSLLERHRKKIDELTKECIEVSHSSFDISCLFFSINLV